MHRAGNISTRDGAPPVFFRVFCNIRLRAPLAAVAVDVADATVSIAGTAASVVIAIRGQKCCGRCCRRQPRAALPAKREWSPAAAHESSFCRERAVVTRRTSTSL